MVFRRAIAKRSFYQDSVALMLLSKELSALPGIRLATAMMGTDNNKALLEEAGLRTAEGDAATANDLIVVVEADSEEAAARALARAEAGLAARREAVAQAGDVLPRTLESALRQLPDANLALISVPGPYAKAEALKALRRGLHVLVFSDNVPLEDEVELKRLARAKGLLCMGPDCGTAIINGVPLGFANAVPRGRIGIASASGTGLQQVSCLAAGLGEGISQAIGVGGRDLHEAVGGIMMAEALQALAGDPGTEVLVLISKPPSPSAWASLAARLGTLGKPSIVKLLGLGAGGGAEAPPGTLLADTLEDAGHAAVDLLAGRTPGPVAFTLPRREIAQLLAEGARPLVPARRLVRGLFAGGTLAGEAEEIIRSLAGGPGEVNGHRILDLGADEFTRGRPHPMIDARLRCELIRKEAADPEVAVILFDIILGYGASPDPAGDLLPAIGAARREAGEGGPCFVASICGTEGDPQGLAAQADKLRDSGVILLPSNAQAARAAALIATRRPVDAALAGGRRCPE